MIDPKKITKFDRTEAELQEFLLFCIVVAGKTASVQAKKLDQFLTSGRTLNRPDGRTPFQKIRSWHTSKQLMGKLMIVKLGQYNRLEKAFRYATKLTNLKTCTLADLEAIPGIGPKTSRFFLLHSRPNQRIAVLDTHILRWLRETTGQPVPRATPAAGPTYNRLEEIYLTRCDQMQRDPAELDLEIWNLYSQK